MAKLPVIIAQTPATTVSGGVRPDEGLAANVGTGLIKAARSAADTFLGLGEAQARVQTAIALGEAHAGAARELDEYRQELDKDPDYATKAERFKKRADEIGAKYGETFKSTLDPEAYGRFQTSYQQTALAYENSVRHAARQDEVQQGRIKLDGANQDLIRQASAARSDVERDALLKQVDDNLTAAVSSGMMTAAQHKEARRGYLSKYEETLAMRMVRSDPSGFINSSADKWKYLDPVRLEVLKTSAQTRIETLGAAARVEARQDAADLIAGYRSDVPPADADKRLAAIKAVDPKAAARVEAERSTAATVAGFRVKPITEQATILNEYRDNADKGGLSGEERTAFLRMQQVHAQEVQKWIADPYLTAAATNPTVKELFDRAGKTVEDPTAVPAALEASLEWQRKNGVPEHNLAVVSRGQAKQIAQELATLDGSAFNQRWAELRQRYGAHFDVLRRQIGEEQKGSGKIAALQTASELPETPKGLAARANLIDAGKANDGDLAKLFPDNKELTATQNAVEEALGNLRLSLGGSRDGMAVAARYRDDATRLAASFMQQGVRRSDAVEKAVNQLVNDHYAFLPDNGGMLRVPRSIGDSAVNVEAVRHNMVAVRDRLAGAELLAPPDVTPGADATKAAEAFARRLKVYSRWLTAQGGREAMLVYEANGRLQPVLRKDGKPVSIDFLAPATPWAPPTTTGPGTGFDGGMVSP